jgi:hypothetical protein
VTIEYASQLKVTTSRPIWKSALFLLMVVLAGYASRRYAHYLPLPIRKRTGDALWACAVFGLVSILRPRWSTLKVMIVALVISYLVEFSQIYHRPWIDHIRAYRLGAMILGTTFFWLDQLAYTIGISLIAPIDFFLICRRGSTNV